MSSYDFNDFAALPNFRVVLGGSHRDGELEQGILFVAGGASDFLIPTGVAGSAPNQIAIESESIIWFTVVNGDLIGRATDSGELVLFTLPEGTRVQTITVSPDGAVWAAGGNSLVRLSADRTIERWGIPGAVELSAIAVDIDGELWITDRGADTLYRLTP